MALSESCLTWLSSRRLAGQSRWRLLLTVTLLLPLATELAFVESWRDVFFPESFAASPGQGRAEAIEVPDADCHPEALLEQSLDFSARTPRAFMGGDARENRIPQDAT